MASRDVTGATAIELEQVEHKTCNGDTAEAYSINGCTSSLKSNSSSRDAYVQSLPSPAYSDNSYPSSDASHTSSNSMNSFDSSSSRSSSIKTCPCVVEPEDCSEIESRQLPIKFNKVCGEGCIRLCIFKYPDYVKWHAQTETVTIEKDETGKLGFHFKEVQSEKNPDEKYTLVHSVVPGGPAYGKLFMGDYILSANRMCLQEKDFLEVVLQNKDKQLHIIKCRPLGLLPLQTKNNDPIRHPVYRRSKSASADLPSRQNDETSESYIKRKGSCKSYDGANAKHYRSPHLTRQGSNKSKESKCSYNSQWDEKEKPNPDVTINIGSPGICVNLTSHTPSPTDSKLAPGFSSIHQTSDVAKMEQSQVDPKLLSAVEAEVTRVLASDMPRLPDLKLFIIGRESNSLAESLLPRRNPPVTENEVYAKYPVCLIKKDDECEWTPTSEGQQRTQPIVRAVTKALGKSCCLDFANTRPSQFNGQHSKLVQQIYLDATKPRKSESLEQVELEVIAMNNTPLGKYCRHVLFTAHSMYIVQFDIDDYFEDKESVLTYIQSQVTQIRSYASNKVQVMLVGTSVNNLDPRKMAIIEESLEESFGAAFGSQLLYNPATNLPCFFVLPHNHQPGAVLTDHKTNDLNRGHVCRQLSSEDNTTSPQSTTDLGKSAEAPIHNGNGNVLIWDADDLKTQITSQAFQQRFISRKYPYQYLIYREQKEKMAHSQSIGAQKSDIMRECQVVKDDEQKALLEYLHDCGEIICMDHLQYMMSQQLLNSRLSFMVLLSRSRLIDAARKLINIPSRAKQSPECRSGWIALQNTAQIGHHFLLHLLGSDSEVLRIFLDMMNLIYCMDDGTSHLDQINKAPQYLVPFYLHSRQDREPTVLPHKPQCFDRILYMDFCGFIPHGMFLSILIQLIGVSNETRGTWKIDSQLSGHVTFANDCALQLRCDQRAATIKISAQCEMRYHPWNIYAVLSQRMKRLKPSRTEMCYKFGPPCPLYQCQGRMHVLNIKDGKGPLWCGKHQIDHEPSVKQWLVEATKSVITPESPEPIPVSNHIKHLPPSLYKWICGHLNVPYASGHNWEMLAGIFGYKMADILIYRQRRTTTEDPCDSLLQDWGRSNAATLETLMQSLERMGRYDIITDMKQRWYFIE